MSITEKERDTWRKVQKYGNEKVEPAVHRLEGMVTRSLKGELLPLKERMAANFLSLEEERRGTEKVLKRLSSGRGLVAIPSNNLYIPSLAEHFLGPGRFAVQAVSDIYEISNKGVGKGEYLSRCILADSVKPAKDVDVQLQDKSGKNLIVEVKAESASCKGNKDASFRNIDKTLEDLWGNSYKQSGCAPQLETNDPVKIRKFLEEVYPEFPSDVVSELVKFWSNTTSLPEKDKKKERQQELGYQIFLAYKKIDKFDRLVLLKKNKENDVVSGLFISDFQDKEFIKKHINFKIQKKRGGCTQAVGDGYTDISLNNGTLKE